MTGPDDLRVGDAERTQVTETLHDHFAQGRLTQDELEERLDATLAAKTVGDLRRVTHDLPGPGPAGGPGRAVTRPRHRRPPVHPLLFVALIVVVAALAGGPLWALAGLLKVIFLGWLVLAVAGIMRARHRRRHAGPPWQHRGARPRGHWRW